MKTPNLDLFNLIKTLSKSEKRYIKVNVGKKNHTYLKLLTAIYNQKVYDEGELKLKFEDEKFIKNLPVTKRYLYDLILKMLARYESKGIEHQVREGIAFVRILLNRKLVKQAEKVLKKNKRLAQEASFFEVLPIVLKLEKQIIQLRNPDLDIIQNLYEEEKEALEKLANINEFWRLNCLLFQKQIQFQKVRTESQKLELQNLMDSDYLQDVTLINNLESKVHFWQAKATYFFTLKRSKEAQDCNLELLKLLDENPKFLSRNLEKYFSTLQNYLIDCFQMHQFHDLEKGLVHLENLTKRKDFQKIQNLESRIFRQKFLLKLNESILKNDPKIGGVLLLDLKLGLEKFKSQIPKHEVLTFHYLATYISFLWSNFEEALDWISPLLKDSKERTLQEVYTFSKVLNLLIHFELGNFQYLESLLSSTRRYLKGMRSLYETEEAVFRFMKKIMELNSKREIQLFLENQIPIFQKLKTNSQEARIFNYIDFEEWIKRKIIDS